MANKGSTTSSERDKQREDEVLRRMLNTPPKPHSEQIGKGKKKPKRPQTTRG